MQNSIGVNYKSCAQRKPLAFNISSKLSAYSSCWISCHWKLDFFYRSRIIMPCFMREDCVSAHAQNLCAKIFELSIILSSFLKLCRADKSEICWIENHHKPFSSKA